MPPPAGTVAAAEMEEEGLLEVRCAGCGDTLEVESGLTEFACPGCATPQVLPPELMHPPRPRRALPLGPARVLCGGCGAVLAVPRGMSRLLACSLCGAEIDVGGGRRLAAHSGVQVISPPGAVTLAATSSRLPEERFKCRLEEAGDTELDPHLVWAQEVGGRSRGRYYGLHGIIDKARINAMAKCTPGRVDKVTKKEMFTQNQVQEMISQATRQLNEAWEKRFQSLEQRMHGMVSSKAPQHNPGPLSAEPVAEDRALHQDASDSEGTYQSSTEDDDDEDYVGD